ncbi:MAG: triple tyrosine motif-containing protein, partial [Fulvivirga sp.]|nr:triple tyrosine motif-containing protein [Fulvivirga sp.]
MIVNRSIIVCMLLFAFGLSFGQPQDTLIVKNFNSGDYEAAAINYTGLVGIDGYYYFANENGVLKYDGSRWELINIKNYKAAFSLAQDSTGKIYVGGLGEIGYLIKKGSGYEYISLNDKIPGDNNYGEFWQIVVNGNDIYYCSYEGILRYDGKAVHTIDHKNSQIYNVDGKIITHVFSGSMYVIENDSARMISEEPKLVNDAAYAFIPTKDPNIYWMFTSEKGVYSFNLQNYNVSLLKLPASNEIIKSGAYDAIVWRDSLIAVSSWYGGFLLLNRQGELVKKLTKKQGLQTNSLREFFKDQRGHIWAGSEYGIIYFKAPTDQPIRGYIPETEITETVFKYTADSSTVTSTTFYYATPGYDKSDLQYAYYLEGFDDAYSDYTSEVKKEYTNLDGGEYTFYVKALLPDGRETQAASMTFPIPTPWYLSAWFIGSSVIILSLLVFGIYRYRTSQLRLMNKKLELIIHDRTKELIQQREQLKSANKELKVINSELDNFVYRSSHDLVAPLKSLKGLVHLAKVDASEEALQAYFDR